MQGWRLPAGTFTYVVEEKLDLITTQRSRAFWFGLALLVLLALFALDTATADQANLIGLLAVPPFVAAVSTDRRLTIVMAVLAVVAALASGFTHDSFGSFEHV